jgi:archaellum component FlaG (FlaF/FlaG flagellin family)
MLAALILIAIVLAAFAFAVYPLYLRYSSTAASVSGAVQRSGQSAGVGISLTYATAQQVSGGTQITLYVYSYGSAPFAPEEFEVYVPGAGTYTVPAASATMTVNGARVGTIPPGAAATISFVIPYTGPVPTDFTVTAIGSGTAVVLSPTS